MLISLPFLGVSSAALDVYILCAPLQAVVVLHLKSQITLPPSPLDSVFSFSEHLELGKKLCMYLVEVVAEEGTQFTGELHRNTTFYFVTKNYPWLRAEWTNRRIFGD